MIFEVSQQLPQWTPTSPTQARDSTNKNACPKHNSQTHLNRQSSAPQSIILRAPLKKKRNEPDQILVASTSVCWQKMSDCASFILRGFFGGIPETAVALIGRTVFWGIFEHRVDIEGLEATVRVSVVREGSWGIL